MRRTITVLILLTIAFLIWLVTRDPDPDARLAPRRTPHPATTSVHRAELPAAAETPIGPGGGSGEMEEPSDSSPSSDSAEETNADSRATVLRIVDAATGRELTDVTLVSSEHFPRDDLAHPGVEFEARILRRGEASPIHMPPDADRWTNWIVGSPGYAWAFIQVDRKTGGERRILLRPGGGLDVRISGPDRDRGCMLRVAPTDQESRAPVAEMNAGERDRFRIDGLPVGTHRVALEIGHWFGDPVVLAEVEATIRPGCVEPVSLTPKAQAVVDLVPLRGTLVIPPAWEEDSPFVAIRLRDPPRAGARETIYLGFRGLVQRRGVEGVWDFDAGRVQPGRYEADLDAGEFVVVFVVPPTGLLDLRLEVPLPGRVVATVIDDTTGKPADIGSIDWHPRRPEPGMGGACHPVERDPETGRFAFRAPRGEIVLDVMESGYRSHSRRVTVGAGTTEVTLRIHPTGGGVHVSVMEGDAVFPWKDDWKVKLEPLEGSGEVCSRSFSVEGTILEMSEEGLYRLTFPKVPGFEPVPPRDVRVSRGKTTEVVIRLTRAR